MPIVNGAITKYYRCFSFLAQIVLYKNAVFFRLLAGLFSAVNQVYPDGFIHQVVCS